jgi:hypothetical protein
MNITDPIRGRDPAGWPIPLFPAGSLLISFRNHP